MLRTDLSSGTFGGVRFPLFVFLVLLAVGKTLALLIYGSGFYLTRMQLLNANTCDFQRNASQEFRYNQALTPYDLSPGDAECWTETRVDKVVLMIIDGARFDFAAASFNSKENVWSGNSPLSSIAETVQKYPETTELYRFVADPPTTTQQRLKSILTGGLPTFLEISKSFGAAKLVEDNLISQAAAAGRRISFSGDDTWLELFHHVHFAASVDAHPSFNVRDLDSVDQGVRRHLLTALDNPDDWDILIGHFLGVDHAGHTYGVESQAMIKKLQENDADIKAISSAMRADSAFDNALLIVMGDHGMTLHGDHGGGTSAETDSFLLIHQPRASSLQEVTQHKNSSKALSNLDLKTMSQIDFAPTLSTILDIPIPYGSLGAIQRRFLEVASTLDPRKETHALHMNNQVIEEWYLRALRGATMQVWRYLNAYVIEAGNPFSVDDWSRLQDLYNSSQSLTASDGDRVQMLEGFLSIAAETSRERWIQFSIRKMAVGVVLLICLLAICAMSKLLFLCEDAVVDARWKSILSRINAIHNMFESRAVHMEMIFLLIVAGLISGYRVSNSFITAEADVAHFIVASFALFFSVFRISFLRRALRSQIRSDAALQSGLGAALLTCNTGCQLLGATWLKHADHGASRHVLPMTLSFLSRTIIFCAHGALPWICHRAMIQGNANGQRACITLASASLGLLTFKHGTCFSVLLRLVGVGTLGPSVSPELFLPWVTYIASSIAFIVPVGFGKRSLNRYKIQIDTHGTMWSLLSIFVLSFGERGSLWGVLSITQSAAVLYSSSPGSAAVNYYNFREMTLALTWHVLALQCFFAGGHHCTFDSLHLTCAFIGLNNFHFVIMGILLSSNTWSGEALISGQIPTVVVSSLNSRRVDEEHLTKVLRNALSRFVLSYAVCRLVTIVVISGFVGAERGHLMVWAVFAPKFAFDAAGQLFGDAWLIFSVLICVRHLHTE